MNELEEKNYYLNDKSRLDIWEEVKNNQSLLYKSIELVQNDNRIVSFLAPNIVDFIIEYPKEVDEALFNEIRRNIFENISLARTKRDIYNTTYLIKLLKKYRLMLTKKEKQLVQKETGIFENLPNSTIVRALHGREPFDLRYYALMNLSWTEDEKKRLIHDWYRSDYILKSKLSHWQNYLDTSYMYMDPDEMKSKYEILNFIKENSPSKYKKEAVLEKK